MLIREAMAPDAEWITRPPIRATRSMGAEAARFLAALVADLERQD